MQYFQYTFIKSSSGRRNTARRYAINEAGLKRSVSFDPEVKEVLSVDLLPLPPATDAQLKYLKNLNVDVPNSVSLREASDLIDNALERRSPGNDLDRNIAERFGVEFSRYTSKAKVSTLVTRSVFRQKSPTDMAVWYVYRVYRDGFDRNGGGGLNNPDDGRLMVVVRQLLDRPALVEELRYECDHSSTGFRWFGDIAGSDGVLLLGDDDGAEVYQFVSSALQRAGLIDRKKREERRYKGEFVNNSVNSNMKKDIDLEYKYNPSFWDDNKSIIIGIMGIIVVLAIIL